MGCACRQTADVSLLLGVGMGTGMGSGIRCTYFILVTLHTNPFQVPMYILCWCGSGCVAKLSPLKWVVFRVVAFCGMFNGWDRSLVGGAIWVVVGLWGAPSAEPCLFCYLFVIGVCIKRYRDALWASRWGVKTV